MADDDVPEPERIEREIAARRAARRATLARAHRRRRATAAAAVVLLAGGSTAVWWVASDRGPRRAGAAERAAATGQDARAPARKPARRGPRRLPVPKSLRGVHVSLYVAGDDARLERFLSLARPGGEGLNAVEIDVKDEAGRVGFLTGVPRLARVTGAAGRFYDPRHVVARAHARGIYVIGRIVCFEDPVLAHARTREAVRTPTGAVWQNNAGLGWVSPYSRTVSDYLVGLAQAAARAGFDEVQFDYVRFPSDGDLRGVVFPGRRKEPFSATLARFLSRARTALHRQGVRISADVFGLAATRDLGIGQNVRRLGPLLDAISPMAYPSHYGPGEFNLASPNDVPAAVVRHTMRDFRRKLRGMRTTLRPWLQDFSLGRTYTPADVRAQIRAAENGGARGWLLWNAGDIYTEQAFATR